MALRVRLDAINVTLHSWRFSKMRPIFQRNRGGAVLLNPDLEMRSFTRLKGVSELDRPRAISFF
jgi:hypothetical protein